MDGLSCGARWCTPCPHGGAPASVCRESDSILDAAERYAAEAQAALDAYDLVRPEDYLQGGSG